MKEISLTAALLSALCGLLGSLALIKGTASVPWEIQSWDGTSDSESAFKAKTRRWLISGLIALSIAFALAAISSVVAYLS